MQEQRRQLAFSSKNMADEAERGCLQLHYAYYKDMLFIMQYDINQFIMNIIKNS